MSIAILGWVVLALVIGGLAYLGWQILRWVNEEFVVTTRRVLQLEGVLNKQVVDSSLEKINDAVLTQSIFGRIFGFGDLDILTASEAGISRLRMLQGCRRLQAGDARGEARAGARAVGSAAAAVAAAAGVVGPVVRSCSRPNPESASPASEPARRTEMTADELTRTLASLADLRDRGRDQPRGVRGEEGGHPPTTLTGRRATTRRPSANRRRG